MKKSLRILLAAVIIICVAAAAAVPAFAAPTAITLQVGETRTLAFRSEGMYNVRWSNADPESVALEPIENGGIYTAKITALKATAEPVAIRADFNVTPTNPNTISITGSSAWEVTVIDVPLTPVEEWLAKLPPWLDGIKGLSSGFQMIIRFFFFGWIWDIFPQNA